MRQCQVDQLVYDEFVKLSSERLASHLCLLKSTAIRPAGIVNIKTQISLTTMYVRIQPTSSVSAERAATVVDEVEECSSATLKALRFP